MIINQKFDFHHLSLPTGVEYEQLYGRTCLLLCDYVFDCLFVLHLHVTTKKKSAKTNILDTSVNENVNTNINSRVSVCSRVPSTFQQIKHLFSIYSHRSVWLQRHSFFVLPKQGHKGILYTSFGARKGEHKNITITATHQGHIFKIPYWRRRTTCRHSNTSAEEIASPPRSINQLSGKI